MFTLQTLGGIDLRDRDGRPVTSILSKPQLVAVLAYLVGSDPGSFHRRDTLIGMIWPDAPERRARRRLNQVLYGLRKALGDDVVVSRGKDEIGVTAGAIQADLNAFRLALEDGRREDALELYRGDFLPSFYVTHAPALEHWIDRERGLLRRAALQAASTLSRESRDAGDPAGALLWARRACAIEPQSEPALRHLMVTLVQGGDRVGAIEVFEAFRTQLSDAYEMQPALETSALAEEIRAVDSAVSPVSGPGPVGVGALSGTGSTLSHPTSDPASIERTHRHNIGLTLAGAGVALVGFAAVLWALLSSPSGATSLAEDGMPPVVVVVPIAVDGSVPPELGDLGRALTEELTARLGRIPGLLLVPSSMVEERAASGSTAIEIGRALSADLVVSGSLEWETSGTRSSAELVDVASGRVLWDVAHRHPHRSILEAQRDITIGIAAALNSTLVPSRVEAPMATSDDHMLAWAFTAQARTLLRDAPVNVHGYARPDHAAVDSLVDRALSLVPDYVPAQAVRSMHFRQRWYEDRARKELADSALSIAEFAVSSDPDNYLAQMALAQALSAVEQADPEGLSRSLTRRRLEAGLRAVQINPNSPEAVGLLTSESLGIGRRLLWSERSALLRQSIDEIYLRRSHWLWILGDYEASLEAHRRLVEVAPHRLIGQAREPELHLSRGDLDAARAGLDAVSTEVRQWPITYAVRIYLHLVEADYEAAERLILDLLERDEPVLLDNLTNFHTQTALAFVYQKTGRVVAGTELARARRTANEGIVRTGAGYVAYYDQVRLNAMLGDVDQAVGWMERAIEMGWPFYYTEMGPEDPMLENVRDDPRFLALMAGLKADLDAERAWVREMMALPEPERFEAMLLDAEEQISAMWEAPS